MLAVISHSATDNVVFATDGFSSEVITVRTKRADADAFVAEQLQARRDLEDSRG